ncbi:hypothetical protein Trydic_g9095 [Trypoxylus dichotomus]
MNCGNFRRIGHLNHPSIQHIGSMIPGNYGHTCTPNEKEQEFLVGSLDLSNPFQIIEAFAKYFSSVYTISQTHEIDIDKCSSTILNINTSSIRADETSTALKQSKNCE